MALAAARQMHGEVPSEIEDLEIRKALVITADKAPFLQLSVDPDNGNFKIAGTTHRWAKEWAIHAVGKLGIAESDAPPPIPLEAVRRRLRLQIDNAEHYEAAAKLGLAYGPAFRGVANILVGESEALAELAIPAVIREGLERYGFHPAMLDAGIQILLGLMTADGDSHGAAYLPVRIKKFRLYGDARELKYCRARLIRRGLRSVVANFDLLTSDGGVIAQIEGLRFQKIDFSHSTDLPAYIFEWQLADSQSPHPNWIAAAAPAPSVIAGKITDEVERLTLTTKRREFYGVDRPRLDRLSACYAADALMTFGAGAAPFSLDDLMHRGNVCPEYRQLLRLLVKVCAEDGYLLHAGRRWSVVRDCPIPDAIELWPELSNASGELLPELVLLARCGQKLSEIMRGEANPVQILFSDKGSSVLEHLYESAPSFRVYNLIAAVALREMVAQWPADRPLRILEIGGGTAGLAITILPELADDDRVSYCFSDVSEAFFDRAQARLRRFRCVRYQTLDIDRDPREQDFAPGSFDLIVGSDVLHVASDLRRTLGWLNELLVDDGELLLLEKHAERMADVILAHCPDGVTSLTSNCDRSRRCSNQPAGSKCCGSQVSPIQSLFRMGALCLPTVQPACRNTRSYWRKRLRQPRANSSMAQNTFRETG
jgi:hypothetical protein